MNTPTKNEKSIIKLYDILFLLHFIIIILYLYYAMKFSSVNYQILVCLEE